MAPRHDRWQEREGARRALDESRLEAGELVHPERPAQPDFAELQDETPQPGSKLVH